jgi:exopolysaccharide biosynthesis polyprenyl glycosylphosphotransferase
MSTIGISGESQRVGEASQKAAGRESVNLGTRTRFEVVADVMERLFDSLTVLGATLLSYHIYKLLNVGRHVHYPFHSLITASCLCSIGFMLLLDNAGAYRRANSLMRIRETERILRISALMISFVFPLTFFSAYLFSRGILLIAAVLVPLALILEKQAFFAIIQQLHLRSRGIRKVLIYGAGYTGKRVFSLLVRSMKLGLQPVAIVDDSPYLEGGRIYESGYTRDTSAGIVRGPITAELIRRFQASMVIVAIPSLSRERLDAISLAARSAGAIMAFVPQVTAGEEAVGEYAEIDGLLLAYRGQRPPTFGYEALKRAFDLVAASLLLCFTAPMWAVLALLIRLDSPGPVLFRQDRVGLRGRVFQMYKFRSMRVDAPKYATHPSDARDPRVTRIGGWLRRTSLDELPQLLNVIRGEMSLVGPRPEMPFIVESYEDLHRQRLHVIPGITGLWQLSADRNFPIHENIHCDLYYIRHRNFFMDAAILLHTVLFAMRGI